MRLYHYENRTVNEKTYSVSDFSIEKGILHCHLTFDSPFTTGISKNDIVKAEIFQKHRNSSKQVHNTKNLLILVHGFATRKIRMANYYDFAGFMAQKGMTCIFINLPFHIGRTPGGETSGERLITFDDVQTLEFFHQAVVDIRRLIDISCTILSPSNTYICGISMGCMVSTIALAFDNRIKKAAFLIGGGNWEEVHWKGIMRYILKGDCSRNSTSKKRLECKKTYQEFPSFMDEFKKSDKSSLSASLEGLDNLKKVTPKACFLCDPMAFGHMIDPDKILMINSRLDLYFSRRSTTYLWKELGRPKLKWISRFHSSKILNNTKIRNMIYDFYTG